MAPEKYCYAGEDHKTRRTGNRRRQEGGTEIHPRGGRRRRQAIRPPPLNPVTAEVAPYPTAFVLSANVHRRNISTGQRAMAIAMLYPEPTKGGRGKKGTKSGTVSSVAIQRITDARVVLRYSPELAQAVMRGEKPLHGALAEARLSQGDSSLARIAGGNFLGSAVF